MIKSLYICESKYIIHMCISSKNISNRTKTLIPGLTRQYISCNCGTCSECRQQKADSWAVRAYFETINVRDCLNGITIFTTLTYAPRHLNVLNFIDQYPHYDPYTGEEYFSFKTRLSPSSKWIDVNCKREDLPPRYRRGEFPQYSHDVNCWNRDDIDTFKASLYRYLNRHGISVHDRQDPNGPKSFIAAECGSDDDYIDDHGHLRHATERAHHHLLLHIPHFYDSDLSLQDLMDEIERLWSYGEVRWSYDQDGNQLIVVDNDFACKYASKYSCKELNYYKKDELVRFLYNDCGEIIKDNKDEIKQYLAKFLVSNHYGECLYHSLKEDPQLIDKLLNGVQIDTELKKLAKADVRHKMPDYITNKFCYEYLEDGRRVLTPFGSVFKLEKLKHNHDYSVNKVRDWLSTFKLVPKFMHLEDSKLQDFNDFIQLQNPDVVADISDVLSFQEWFTAMLGNYDIKHFVLYKSYLRGRKYYVTGDHQTPSDLSPDEVEYYADQIAKNEAVVDILSYPYFEDGVFCDSDLLQPLQKLRLELDYHCHQFFDHFPSMHRFEVLISTMTYLDNLYHKEVNEFYLNELAKNKQNKRKYYKHRYA